MDFKAVSLALQEVFPQVDPRILKAVAIEHSKDVDAAVEFVITDVLPFISELPQAPSSLVDALETNNSSQISESSMRAFQTGNEGAEQANTDQLSESNVVVSESVAHCESLVGADVSKHSGQWNVEHETPVGSSSDLHGGSVHEQSLSNAESGSLCSDGEAQQKCCSSHLMELENLSIKVDDPIAVSRTHQDSSSAILNTTSGLVEIVAIADKNFSVSVGRSEDQSSRSLDLDNIEDFNRIENNHAHAFASSDSQEPLSSVPKNLMDPSEFHYDFSYFSDGSDGSQSKNLTDNGAQISPGGNMVSPDVDCEAVSVATGSSQIVSIDYLEDFVIDARDNKKILMSAMESTIDMIKEVELHEERVKQAKEEASTAGEDTRVKVEELKLTLKHAKEANDMHAGEVYGEKCILATEARELQSRVLNLASERDHSLSVIEEIRRTLEARLAAAKDEIAAAEQEKLGKEELARKALVEQEQIMESVVQESKKLKQQAEENSKLREFLMDRGRVVDILQGEIAVICEDVRALKEKADCCIPLGRSLHRSISSRTGSLISSTISSHNSMSDRVDPEVELTDILMVINQHKSEASELGSSNIGKLVSDHKHKDDSDASLVGKCHDDSDASDIGEMVVDKYKDDLDGWELFDSAELASNLSAQKMAGNSGEQ